MDGVERRRMAVPSGSLHERRIVKADGLNDKTEHEENIAMTAKQPSNQCGHACIDVITIGTATVQTLTLNYGQATIKRKKRKVSRAILRVKGVFTSGNVS